MIDQDSAAPSLSDPAPVASPAAASGQEGAADGRDPGASRLGVFGLLDRDRYGEGLALQILSEQLGQRRPWAEIHGYAPFGEERAPARADRWPVRGLGVWSLARARELADALDLVAVTGDLLLGGAGALASAYGLSPRALLARSPSAFLVEGLGSQLERRRPVIWHCVGVVGQPDADEGVRLRRALASRAYVSVRDDAARRLLERLGLEREVAVVPDPLLLLPQHLREPERRRRLETLRLLGAYPSEGAPIVVELDPDRQGSAEDLAPAIEEARARLGDRVVVVVATAAGDEGEAATAALAERLSPPVHRLSAAASEKDVAAVIASASAVVASSPAAWATAIAYGRPAVALALGDGAHLEGAADLAGAGESVVHDLSELPGRLVRALDAPVPEALRSALAARVSDGFDRLADLAERARWARRLSVPFGGAGAAAGAEVADVRRAHEERERTLLDQRASDQDQIARLTAETERLRGQVDGLARRLGGFEQELSRANSHAEQMSWEVFHRDAAVARFHANQQALVDETGRLTTQLRQREAAVSAERAEVERLTAALADARAELDSLVRSRSWRATAPIRLAARRIRQGG